MGQDQNDGRAGEERVRWGEAWRGSGVVAERAREKRGSGKGRERGREGSGRESRGEKTRGGDGDSERRGRVDTSRQERIQRQLR